MLVLKQSTSIDIRMGPFVDSTDGVTPETGVTLGAADQAEVLKANGAATSAMAGTFAAVTGADGWYDYTVATGDVDTVGEVVFVVQDSSLCLPVFTRAYVVEEAVYDALYASGSAGPLQSTTAGRTLDVTTGGAAGIDWGNVENAGTTVDLSATSINLCDTITTYTGNTVQTGDSFARLGAPAGASVSADIATAQADLDIVTGADGATVSSASLDSIADSVWDEPISGHLTAGSAGVAEALGSAAILDTTATGTPTSTTVPLTAGSSIDDFYNDQLAYILSGTGVGQVRVVTDYDQATKTITVDEAWITTPVSGDRVAILVDHVHSISQIATNVRTEMDSNSTQLSAIVTDTNSLNDTKIPQTLNLTASGNIGIDWANVENPTTAVDLSATDIQLCDTITTYTGNTVQTGDSFARLGAPAGASVSADVADIKTDTGTTLPGIIDDLSVKKNATFSNFEFLMVLTSDGRTPATGKTVTGQRSIDGGAFTNVGGTIAEVSNGIYQFDALAADTNGDVITWRFSNADCDDTFVTFKTVQ